ncbi:MAG: hydroxypyruvate isomerase, partial [Delftia sp.]|nr:hydroxypyruvate isomerase [Delftia sp.]
IGYQGWVGCEYKPARDTESGLGWLDAHTSVRAAVAA